VLILKLPQVFNNSNVVWILWRARPWPNYDSREDVEVRKKLGYGKVIVFDNIDGAVWDREPAQSSKTDCMNLESLEERIC
jgi:hypothetical protein